MSGKVNIFEDITPYSMLTGMTANVPIASSTNVDRLKGNSDSKRLGAIFRGVKMDDLYVTKQMMTKAETRSGDIRLMVTPQNMLTQRAQQVQREEAARKGYDTYMNKPPKQRRMDLRRMSKLSELEMVLDKLKNEILVIGSDNVNYCTVKLDTLALKKAGIPEDVINKIQETIDTYTPTFLAQLGLTGKDPAKKMLDFLIEGKLAYECIFDDIEKPTKIIGFKPIDAFELSVYYPDGQRMYQYNDRDPFTGHTVGRILYPWQVVQIDWQEDWTNGKMSYLEGILKDYNIMRIIHEAKIVDAVSNATRHISHTIPAKGHSRKKAEQMLAEYIAEDTDQYRFDYETGDLRINGEPNIPFSKKYYGIEGDEGKTEIGEISHTGPDLSQLEQDKFFTHKFYAATRLPRSRFDEDYGQVWNIDVTTAYNIEVSFAGFLDSIRAIWNRLIVQPLQQQIAIDVEAVRGNIAVSNAILVEWNALNYFREDLEMQLLLQKLDHIEKKMSFTYKDNNGEEVPYFPFSYLLEKDLKLSAKELKLIEKYRKEETKKNAEFEKFKQEIINNMGLVSKDDEEFQHEKEMAEIEFSQDMQMKELEIEAKKIDTTKPKFNKW